MDMKKFVSILVTSMIVLILSSIIASPALGIDLYFTWKANPSAELVTSYVIYQANNIGSTNFGPFRPVSTAPGSTNVWPVRGLSPGTYKFRVVAINGAGGSLPSNEVTYPTNNPSKPLEFQITVPK